MSDTTTGTRPDPDELANAYLDGELDATQRAAVEADPALLARVDELAAVRAAVAGPVASPPPGAEAAALAAALAVHDQLWAPRPAPAPEKRRWWERLGSRRAGPVLAGAALVAVAAVGVAAVVNDDDASDSSTDLALSAPDTSVAASVASPASAAAGGQDTGRSAGAGDDTGGGAPAALAASAPAPYLGSLADDGELVPLLREIPPASPEVVSEAQEIEATQATEAAADASASSAGGGTGASTTPAETAPASTLPATTATSATAPAPESVQPLAPPAARTVGATCPAPDQTVFYATLDLDGTPVEVFVGVDRAVAVEVDGCTAIAEVPLP